MTLANRLNSLTIFLLIIFVALGCNLLQSKSDSAISKDSIKSEESAPEGGHSDENEIEITQEDAFETETDKKPVKTTSKSTVVKFGKGKTTRGYENAVVRGEKHTYVLGANKGQRISVNVKALEDNAVFYIKKPNGKFLGNLTDSEPSNIFNGTLPASGKYKIVVSPTRGNATYKINFSVKDGDSNLDPPVKKGGVTKTVKFSKGGTSARYSNSVVRGDRDTYILGASSGQVMSVNITSLENNAEFSIRSPKGGNIASGVKKWSGQLPADGKYRIVVGGTRGNATYKIRFTVK